MTAGTLVTHHAVSVWRRSVWERWKSTLLSALSHGVLSPSSANTSEARATAESVMVWNRPVNSCRWLIKGCSGLWIIQEDLETGKESLITQGLLLVCPAANHHKEIKIFDCLLGSIDTKIIITLSLLPVVSYYPNSYQTVDVGDYHHEIYAFKLFSSLW